METFILYWDILVTATVLSIARRKGINDGMNKQNAGNMSLFMSILVAIVFGLLSLITGEYRYVMFALPVSLLLFGLWLAFSRRKS